MLMPKAKGQTFDDTLINFLLILVSLIDLDDILIGLKYNYLDDILIGLKYNLLSIVIRII